jgi:hypothetical protein
MFLSARVDRTDYYCIVMYIRNYIVTALPCFKRVDAWRAISKARNFLGVKIR